MLKTSAPVILRIPPEQARAALRACLAGLDRLGIPARIEGHGHAPVDPEIERVLAFEQRLHRLADHPGARLALPLGPAGKGLVISLAGPSPDADLVLWLDGEAGMGQLERSLVNGHVPLVECRDAQGQVMAAGLPAIEQPDILGRALVAFYARLATILAMAIDGTARSRPDRQRMREAPTHTTPLEFFLQSTARKVANRIAPSRRRAEHWRIAIRPVTGPFNPEGDDVATGFTLLPDDGARYYADPVLWQDAERTYLFMEEFPYDTGMGCLAFTELGPEGRALFTPRRFLAGPTHLSYPFLFRHAGEVFLMPENAAAGRLTFYRARRFPDLWEEHSVPIPDRALHDATLIQKDGRWWLLANEERGGSSWDTLVVFSAPDPLGPFEPHHAAPMLVDARLARSAGPVIRLGERLIRPVQNCLGGYGRFLRFTEVTELDDRGFEQREIGRLLPEDGLNIAGLHTYARSERFEAIDLLTPRNWRPA